MSLNFLFSSVCEKELRLNSSFDILWKNLPRIQKRGELSSRVLLSPRWSCPPECISWLIFSTYCFHRFPFIACEIFTCEVDIILKTLVEDEEVRNSILLSLKPYFSITTDKNKRKNSLQLRIYFVHCLLAVDELAIFLCGTRTSPYYSIGWVL